MPDSPFASFKGTYQPLPIQVFDETQRVLQDQYFKNRDAEDKLRSSINNLNVDDRDRDVLNRTIASVDEQLSSINGEYEKAGNVIRNVVRNIDSNDELKAAVQDKSIFDATLKQLQEKSLDGKSGITNEAVQAFVTLSKNSKKGSIYKDENGVIQNRMSISPPPLKVDTDDMVMKIAEQVTKNPNVIEQQYPGARVQLANYLGVTEQQITSVSREQLQAAVGTWLMTRPEVKNYYDYINTAKVVNQFGDGAVPIDRLLSDFGLAIGSDGNGELATYSLMKDEKGNVVEIDTSLSGIANRFIEEAKDKNGKLDINKYNQLSRQFYIDLATNLDKGKISDFAGMFAFTKYNTTTKYLEDIDAKNRREDERQQRTINGMFYNSGGVQTSPEFDIKEQELRIGKSRDNYKKQNDEYTRLLELKKKSPSDVTDFELENARKAMGVAKRQMVTDEHIYTQLANTAITDPLIKSKVDSEYEMLYNETKEKIKGANNVTDYIPTKQELYDYLSGKSNLPLKRQLKSELNVSREKVQTTFGQVPIDNSPITISERLTTLKNNFQELTQKKVRKEGLKGVSGQQVTFTENDKNGNLVESSIHPFMGDEITRNSTNYTVRAIAGKESGDLNGISLDEVLKKKGVDLYNYNVSAKAIKGNKNATFVYGLTFTPKNKDAKTQPIYLEVQGDPTMAAQNALTMTKLVMEKVDRNKIPEAYDWAKNELGNAIYKDAFSELENVEYAVKSIPDGTEVFAIPIKTGVGLQTANGIIRVRNNMYEFVPYIKYDSQGRGILDTNAYMGGKTIQELYNNIAEKTYMI